MDRTYAAKMLDFITLIFVIIGALNWGIVGVTKFNVVDWLGSKTFPVIATIIYVVIGLSALFHVFSRSYYLPFLGDTVYPCNALEERVPAGADFSAKLQTSPGAIVVYWAAEPSQAVKSDPWAAYGGYENHGVARADGRGVATLMFKMPGQYRVGLFGRTLKPHLHYRVCRGKGMLGPVRNLALN